MFFQLFPDRSDTCISPYKISETVNESLSITRYKPSGQDKLDDGSPDCVEFYSFGQDHMLGTFPHKYPDLVEANRKNFQDFLHHAHDIVNHLLSHLDKHLALQPNTLASLIPQDRRSGTSLRLLKSKPQTVDSHRKYLASHTDIGAMTMLFNVNGGLQLLPAGSENLDENWRYVRPEPGCALINLGDAMVQYSGGILRSNIHRVATPPGEQAACTRYSIAYLVHPEANASMRRLQGGGIIPQPGDGEEDEDVRAEEWGRIRVARIISGKSIPASSGGVRLEGQKMQEAL